MYFNYAERKRKGKRERERERGRETMVGRDDTANVTRTEKRFEGDKGGGNPPRQREETEKGE